MANGVNSTLQCNSMQCIVTAFLLRPGIRDVPRNRGVRQYLHGVVARVRVNIRGASGAYLMYLP